MFAWLRPGNLIWNYWAENYLLGQRPPAFDVRRADQALRRLVEGPPLDASAIALKRMRKLVAQFDRLTQQVLGTMARPAAMPMDAYRQGDAFYIHLDLPGIQLDSIDLTVEQSVLTIRAERAGSQPDGPELIVAERPAGVFTRQVFRGETLDPEHMSADYTTTGVLPLSIPVRESAKPREVEITSQDAKQLNSA